MEKSCALNHRTQGAVFTGSQLASEQPSMPDASSAFERLLDAQAEEMLASMERIKQRRQSQAGQPSPLR